MKNPFRTKAFRGHFDDCVRMFETKHKNLFSSATGNPNHGNGVATSFWRGYNGVTQNWDRASKETFAYPAFKAGAACRAAVNAEAAKKE